MICEGSGSGSGDGNNHLAELALPPVQVIQGAPGRGVWAERTVIERCKHHLQAGEVGMPSRDDQHCMQELSVQSLCFKEIVCAFLPPLGNDCEVPSLFSSGRCTALNHRFHWKPK